MSSRIEPTRSQVIVASFPVQENASDPCRALLLLMNAHPAHGRCGAVTPLVENAIAEFLAHVPIGINTHNSALFKCDHSPISEMEGNYERPFHGQSVWKMAELFAAFSRNYYAAVGCALGTVALTRLKRMRPHGQTRFRDGDAEWSERCNRRRRR